MNDKNINDPDSLLEELTNLNDSLKNEVQGQKGIAVDRSTLITTEFEPPPPVVPPKKVIPLTEEELGDFVLRNTQTLVTNGLEVMEELKLNVASTEDSRAMGGFAEIVRATNSALDTLNAINIQKKKEAAAKEIKEMDIQSKKELQASKIALPAAKTTVNVISTRENIVKMLANIKEGGTLKDIIEGESTEPEDVQPEGSSNALLTS